MAHVTNCHATIEADSHSAQRSARLSADRCAKTRDSGLQQSCGKTHLRIDADGFAIHNYVDHFAHGLLNVLEFFAIANMDSGFRRNDKNCDRPTVVIAAKAATHFPNMGSGFRRNDNDDLSYGWSH